MNWVREKYSCFWVLNALETGFYVGGGGGGGRVRVAKGGVYGYQKGVYEGSQRGVPGSAPEIYIYCYFNLLLLCAMNMHRFGAIYTQLEGMLV